MRIVTVRDLRTHTRRMGEWLSEGEAVVVTSNGKPIAVLSPVTEDAVESEITALRQARAVRAFAALQQKAHTIGLDQLSEKDIDQEISEARKGRTGRE